MRRVAVDLGGRAIVLCDVASTPAEQAAGLQIRNRLSPGEGMLFPFEPARATMFHMAGVSYPIDILFLGADQRIAKMITNAQPGTGERWQHAPCIGVVEVPGGYSERIGLRLGDYVHWSISNKLAQATYDLLRGLTDGDSTEPDAERYEERGMPDDAEPLAQPDDDSMPGWEQTEGYDLTNDDFLNGEGPAMRMSAGQPMLADIVLNIIEDLTAQGLKWHYDPLTRGKVAHAVIAPRDLTQWLNESPDEVRQAMLSDAGLRVIGDGLILTGIADSTQIANGNLILWRGVSHEA